MSTAKDQSYSAKSFSDISFSSLQSNRQKYRGLLKRSPLKEFRDKLFQFFDYIYKLAPSYAILSTIMRYLHFIQIQILAFYPYSTILWPQNSLLSQICKIISIVGFIIPARTNLNIHLVFELILIILFIIVFIYFVYCIRTFSYYTNVAPFSIKLFTILLNAFLPYLITMTSSNFGLNLFLILAYKNSNNKYDAFYRTSEPNIVIASFNFVLGFFILIFMIFLQVIIVTPSLTFRPQVINIFTAKGSLIYFIFITVFSFSSTFGSIYGGFVGLFFMFVPFVPILFLLFQLYFHSEILTTVKFQRTITSLTSNIFFMIIIIPTLLQAEIIVNEVVIFIFLILLALFYNVLPIFIDAAIARNRSLLDNILDEKRMDISDTTFLQIIRTGFDGGHQVCHNWKIFKIAHSRLYNNKTFLSIFARYAAIYPDESSVLSFACKIIRKKKHNSLEMKYLLYQSENLLQQRERKFSKRIKKACKKISDKTEKCRNQLRVIWESVISGATSELESLTTQLKRNEDEITREYSQLCWLYPNNPYVVSDYSAFLSGIMCKDREAAEYAQIYKQLKSGARTQLERSYYFAIKALENLPTEAQHAQLVHSEENVENNDPQKSAISSIAMGTAFFANAFGENPDELNQKAQHRYMETMIESVRLPSLRYGPFILFLCVSLLFPILSIILIVNLNLNLKNNLNGVRLMEEFSLLRTYICQIPLTSFYYALSKNNYVNALSNFFNITYDENRKPLTTDETLFLLAVNESLVLLNNINEFFPSLSGTGFFGEPLTYLNSPSFEFDVYSSLSNSSQSLWSFQHICSFFGFVAVEMTNKKNYQLLGFPEFRTVVTNSFSVLNQSQDMLNTFIDSHESMMNDFFRILTVFIIAIGLSCLILVTIIDLIIFFKLSKEKNMLFNSFKLLPKSSISPIVSKLNAQSGRTDNGENIVRPLTVAEENAIKALNTSTDRSYRTNGWILIAICIIIAYLAVISIIAFVFSLKNDLTSRFPQMSSLIFYLTRIHSTFYLILLTEMRIASMNHPTLQTTLDENVSQLLDECDYLIRVQLTNLYFLRFGPTNINSGGLSSIGDDMISLFTTNEMSYDFPNDSYDILNQCSLDNKIMYIYDLLDGIYKGLEFKSTRGDDTNLIQVNDTRFEIALQFLLKDGSNVFVKEGLDLIDERITELNNEIKYNKILSVIIVLDVIIVVCGIFVMEAFRSIGERAQWALRLLLFCPANVVFQSHSISKLLSNDFTRDDSDETDESTQFYNDVIGHYRDPVIFMDNELRIHGANESFLTLFKKSFDDIQNRKIEDILTQNYENLYQNDNKDDCTADKNNMNVRFKVSIRNFLSEISKIEKSLVPPTFNGIIEMVIDNEFYSFSVSLIAINKEGEIANQVVQIESLSLFSLIMINQTESVKLQQEYEKEQKTIRKLLSVFIPMPLVDEYSEMKNIGDIDKSENHLLSHSDNSHTLGFEPSLSMQLIPTNSICLSVQSVSVVMIDIVGFSIWASKKRGNAAKIMQRLNKMYSEFEKILSNYSEMIKISSLSDTFIAAGGILSDVNQPQVHAKQAVSFGIDAISHLDLINVEHATSLKIRVGVNNGGPAVAGVLTLNQPAFILLGEPISFTIRMKETGKPMQVHIPQVVYDYIYGENFVIKEGDPVDYKEQTYNTYFVTAYDQQYEAS